MMRTSTYNLALAFALVASLYLDFALITGVDWERLKLLSITSSDVETRPLEDYSFIGNDFPRVYPVKTKPVLLTVEESVHYSPTAPEAYDEWLYNSPMGDHNIRLGPEKRAFVLSVWHELHCLRNLRKAMDEGMRPGSAHHYTHCLHYLRQWTLCSADTTLEFGDFATRNFTVERVGATHVCQDWSSIYDVMRDNWHEWVELKDKYVGPIPNKKSWQVYPSFCKIAGR